MSRIFTNNTRIPEYVLEMYLAMNGYDIWSDETEDAIDSTKVIQIAADNGFVIEDPNVDGEFVFVKKPK